MPHAVTIIARHAFAWERKEDSAWRTPPERSGGPNNTRLIDEEESVLIHNLTPHSSDTDTHNCIFSQYS